MKIFKISHSKLLLEDVSSDLNDYLQEHIEDKKYSFMNECPLIKNIYIIYDDGVTENKYKNKLPFPSIKIPFEGNVYLVKMDDKGDYFGLENKDIDLIMGMINE